MSYCRFTEDSDVYAYECDGGVQFWVAGKANSGLDHLCNTYNEAYQYAKSLRDEYGLDVPDYAIDALRSDALEEVKRFNGPKSVVAELKSENAKLRELVRDAWGSGHPDRSCEGCDIRDECHDDIERLRKDGIFSFSRCLFELRIEERMRELGIEVG